MPANCGICSASCANDESEPLIKCAGSCGKLFHIRCVKDNPDAKKLRSTKEWKCKDCRSASSSHGSGHSIEGTALTKEFLIRIIDEFKTQISGELKTFKSEIVELSSAVKFFSEQMDESTSFIKEVKEELAAVRRENEALKSKSASLAGEVASLKDKIRSLEQYTRKNNIEISGLPITQNENVLHLVRDVGAALGVPEVQDCDINAAHRIPSFRKDRTPSIVVQFMRRSSRDSWLANFREKRGMTARQVNAVFPQQRVYVNEHLSPDNKVFLAHLKNKCKEIGYSYAWCRDGKFFVRKCQGERYLRVDTYEDLHKLK